MTHLILQSRASCDYELLDSGEGEKLERFGSIVISRPDPQALWFKKMPRAKWSAAHAVFVRGRDHAVWQSQQHVPERWEIELDGLRLWVKLSPFKHTGVFPEYLPNWQWIGNRIVSARRPATVLNLFGYTGGATLASARAGAHVCHVDGSKPAILSARENAKLSGLQSKPIRWITDDARAFVKREIRRSSRYDGIILDPPTFGRGPKQELWKIERDLAPLVDMCGKLLSDKPLFFILSGYASGYSALAYGALLRDILGKCGRIEIGELTIVESSGGRLLPCGIFARWQNV